MGDFKICELWRVGSQRFLSEELGYPTNRWLVYGFFFLKYVCNFKIYALFANVFRFPIYSCITFYTFHIANSNNVIVYVEKNI